MIPCIQARQIIGTDNYLCPACHVPILNTIPDYSMFAEVPWNLFLQHDHCPIDFKFYFLSVEEHLPVQEESLEFKINNYFIRLNFKISKTNIMSCKTKIYNHVFESNQIILFNFDSPDQLLNRIKLLLTLN